MKACFFLIVVLFAYLNVNLAQNIFTSVDAEREVIVQLKDGTFTPPQK
ncbi:MAG: hypothetical protein MUP85_23510 [Candidatus Lokiarchaeota archaeon]|nr:hypothetical protein [Candidatus Lokiarchaeota archaeon]